MQTTCKPPLNWLLTGGLMLGLAAASQAAITTIADTFTLTGTDRAVNGSLEGLTSQVGNAIWRTQGSQAAGFTDHGSVSSIDPGNGWTAPQAFVGFTPAGSLLTATMDFNTVYNQWVGLAFAGDATTDWWSQTKIEIFTRGDGTWYVDGPGFGTSGTVAGLGSSTHTYTLIYDLAAQQVTAKLDGVTLLNQATTTGMTVGAAGFKFEGTPSFNNTSGWPPAQVDSFAVVIPEPASLGLLLVAGGLLAARRRRG